MVMRVGGLASGMDIDELVKKLMNAERAPLNKLTQKKTTYEWQRDAYRSVNTKLRTFDTYISDNLILKSLNSKTATSSNSSLVSASATGKATGTLSIEGVSQLATSTKAVGEQKPVTVTSKLSTLFNGDMPTELKLGSINSQGNLGEAATIKINEDTTIDQFISKINESSAGVSAIFENGQLSITTKNTGRVASGESAISMDEGAKEVFGKLGITQDRIKEGQNARFVVNGIATERSSNSFSINGYNVTLKSTFNEAATHAEFNNGASGVLITAQSQLDETFSNLASANKYNTDLSTFTTNEQKYTELSKAISAVIDKRKAIVENSNAVLNSVSSESLGTANAKSFLDSLTEEQKTKFQSKALTEAEITELGLDETQKQAYDNLNENDKASLTKTAGGVYNSLSDEAKTVLSTMNVGDDLSSSGLTTEEQQILSNLTNDELTAVKAVATQEQVVKDEKSSLNVAISDLNELNAKYTAYEKAKATSDSIGAPPTQDNKNSQVTLSSTTNVDDMMTKIKEFVNTYNGLIKDLKNQTGESKYRDYAPLTAEQKEDMSENEIKLWEEKAKSGLLRNDALIRTGLADMRSLVYQSNPGIDDSKFNTLYNIGITTSKNYNEGGTLEIDEVKLRKAIEENPDAVEKLFKNSEGKKEDTIQVTDPNTGAVTTKTVDSRGYLEKLRESMKNFEISIEKKAGRSTMTDAQYSIGKSLMDTEKRISTWQDKLKNIEARYWKQFTAMEQAINKANSQSSMFMQG